MESHCLSLVPGYSKLVLIDDGDEDRILKEFAQKSMYQIINITVNRIIIIIAVFYIEQIQPTTACVCLPWLKLFF